MNRHSKRKIYPYGYFICSKGYIGKAGYISAQNYFSVWGILFGFYIFPFVSYLFFICLSTFVWLSSLITSIRKKGDNSEKVTLKKSSEPSESHWSNFLICGIFMHTVFLQLWLPKHFSRIFSPDYTSLFAMEILWQNAMVSSQSYLDLWCRWKKKKWTLNHILG